MSEPTVHKYYDAYVVLGGGLTSEEKLPEPAEQRVDMGVDAWVQDPAAHLIMTGKHTFMLDTPPATTEADEMALRALKRVAEDRPNLQSSLQARLVREKRSLDTIGNAVFTKQDFLAENGLRNIALITSGSHSERALHIFRHVLGPDYNVDGMAAPESLTLRTRASSAVGYLTMRAILRGTEPGDDRAIEERMYDLVPGYKEDSKATKLGLATRSILELPGAIGTLLVGTTSKV